MDTEMALLTFNNPALRTILAASMTTQLGEIGWRWSSLRMVVRLNKTMSVCMYNATELALPSLAWQ